jgi:hypothetical protein
MQKCLHWLLWLWLLLSLSVIPANAQAEPGAYLTDLITDSFPRIHLYLDVHDTGEDFVHALDAGDIRVLENGKSLAPVEFEELRPGVQTVIAVNPGEAFEIRNSQGVSRYDLLRQVLLNWLARRSGSSVDDLSLIIAGGPERTHTDQTADVIEALNTYQIEPGATDPSLDVLMRAVDLASDEPPRQGMERAVIFITSPLRGDLSAGLQTVLARAAEQRVRIFVWLVGAQDAFDTQSARQMRDLAQQTRGEFFPVTGLEDAPDLESILDELREIYHLSYNSQITAGGQQQVSIAIEQDGQAIQSPVLEFDFELIPPQPAFISPAPEIVRTIPTDQRSAGGGEVDNSMLRPLEQMLQVLIEFPDGRPRSLRRTALYVDGELVAENTTPPFDAFVWDMTPYTETGQHILQAEAVDEMGLAGRSVETLVQVVVNRPRPNVLSSVIRHWPFLAALLAVLLSSFLFLALVLSGRITPRIFGKRFGLRGRRSAKPAAISQPVIVPIDSLEAAAAMRASTGWANRIHWPQRRLASKAFAFMTPLSSDADTATGPPVSISANELTLGSDPNQATLVLDDPSVDALHARLRHIETGVTIIMDQGSIAGTWVNYALVPRDGLILEHGDLVHIGRICLRFTLRHPNRVRKPTVHYEEKAV